MLLHIRRVEQAASGVKIEYKCLAKQKNFLADLCMWTLQVSCTVIQMYSFSLPANAQLVVQENLKRINCDLRSRSRVNT